MIHKTIGIVFKVTPYSESSVVVQIFTKKFGLKGYLVNGVRKIKSKYPQSLFQPLNLLEMEVYHKENSTLQRTIELKNIPAFVHIPFDVQKTTMVLFLNEMLYKTINHDFEDEKLFDFIYHSLLWLDLKEPIPINFHLAFLMKLTKYLGISPSFEKEFSAQFFDIVEGKYVQNEPLHPYFLKQDEADFLKYLFNQDFDELIHLTFTNIQRRYILRKILDYYHLHINSVDKIKSLEILEQLFS